MDTESYVQLKKRVESAQRRVDEAAGAIATLETRLKEEFGCESVEAAERLQTRLKKEKAAALKAYEEERKKFEEKWNDRIESS